MSLSSQVPVLAIDGPSGTGKGTVGSYIAKTRGWHLLDSGALYRAFAFAANEQGIAPDDIEGIEGGDERKQAHGDDGRHHQRHGDAAVRSERGAIERARDVYGVVLTGIVENDDLAIDREATAAARSSA